MVFTPESRVCYREQGSIATDVEIIQPTIMNGVLMYQVKAITPPGQPTVLLWVPASGVEPSADADAWEYAWWNRVAVLDRNETLFRRVFRVHH